MFDTDFIAADRERDSLTSAPRKTSKAAARERSEADSIPRDQGERDSSPGDREQPGRRLAVKLRMLGSNAGFLLLLTLAGLVALAGLGLLPSNDRLLWWAVPMATACGVLVVIWNSRHRQYEHPTLTWYIALVLAAALIGIAWGPFMAEAVRTTGDSWLAVSVLLVLAALMIMGTLLLAIDLILVSVHLGGFIVSAMLYVVQSGSPPPQLLWLTGVSILLLPLLAIWSHRQQRRLVRAAAELNALRPRYQALVMEAGQTRQRLDAQVSHQKKVEQELYLAKEEAEGASVAKTEFLATMSHEIRTPLNGIVPILEILRETRLNEEQAEFVTTALNSSHHLLNLINDILDYSKIEAGKLEIETIELEVDDVVGSVISLMTKSAERRGLRLKTKIASNVPKQVRGDPFRLRQILTNLVGNAIKFTEKGSVAVEVSRHASSPREVVLLFAVRDTGIGMSKKATDTLFQEFSQADASTTRKYGGTGLGLVICKRLVEIMGGRIGVKSVPGKGSVFWFVVPMRRALHEVPSSRKSLQGVRALLAGFDELEQQRLAGLLNEWGMLHEYASTGADALTKLRASSKLGASWGYDVLMVDAQTLGSGVAGLTRDIGKVFELSSLVVLAVDSFPSVAANLRDAGIGEVIARPVQEQDLRARLYRLLDVQAYSAGKKQEPDRRLLMPDAQYSWEDEHQAGRQGDNSAPARSATTGKGTSSVFDGNAPLKGKVLVVEDNPVNLSVVKKLLQRFGVDCEAARDGLEAVEAVKQAAYDLVLMDVQMPNMDGHEATRAIRAWEKEQSREKTMPILAMTANAMAGDREKCLDAGMDDYMSKPVKPADLKEMLRHWLSAKSGAEGSSGDRETAAKPEPIPEQPQGGVQSMGYTGVLDRETLEELFDIMEAEATGLLQEYLDNAPTLLEDIDQAVGEGDAVALVLPAHSLKSSSANVGAVKVSELAKKLEFMGRENNMGEAKATWKRMQNAYIEAEQALKGVIDRGAL